MVVSCLSDRKDVKQRLWGFVLVSNFCLQELDPFHQIRKAWGIDSVRDERVGHYMFR